MWPFLSHNIKDEIIFNYLPWSPAELPTKAGPAHSGDPAVTPL